jgi:CubicO group peptidase (beta-lactamase class C family)
MEMNELISQYSDDNKPKFYNDQLVLDALHKKLKNEKILSCLIQMDNKMIFEYYKNKKVKSSVQTICSCTKSVLSALIGIAIDLGLIENIHVPITRYFGDIIEADGDIRKQEITIEHLLTMSPGIHWPEFGEWNCFAPMVYSKDINRFILERPLIQNPGEKMNYNSGCSHLLSDILQQVSGMSTHEFAKEYLFKPLGITQSTWHSRQGVSLGADGLKITSEDMLKIGKLFLHVGKFNNKRIISTDWIDESVTPRYLTYKNIGHYGYHWWASSYKTETTDISYYFALGYGGQYIIVVPKFDLVVVFTSRLFPESLQPLEYFKNYILESIKVL